MRRSATPRAWSRPSTNGRSSRTPAWDRAAAWSTCKDDKVTVWTGSPKSHFCRDGVAAILGVPVAKVDGISMQSAGSYGRNDAGDACMDAAVLSKAVGKPVRVQYMRDEGTGWDPKGPASIHRGRAAIDASGNVVAYEFSSKGFSRGTCRPTRRGPSARSPAISSACR